jgi:O-antigen ligase
VLAYLAGKRLTSWRKRALALLLAGVVAAGVIASLFWLRDDSLNTLRQRLTYGYPDTLQLLQESPLLGAGTGNGMVEIGWNYAHVTFQWNFQVRLPAHNAFLMEAASTGLIGMAFYALAWGLILWHGLRLTHPGGRVLALAFVCVTLVSFFDYYFRGDMRSQVLLFVLIGTLWGEMLRERTPHQSESGG